MVTTICGSQITALILAGGRGARMGGADKGLQPLGGQTLVRAVLDRLAAQTLRPACIAISANRNLDRYAAIGQAFDAPVWPDDAGEPYVGPLAGMLTGLRRATTPCLLTVPCDAPCLPLSLCERLARALQGDPEADVAVACAPNGEGGDARVQPAFCLLRRDADGRLARELSAQLDAGDRKASAWIVRQRYVIAHFGRDASRAFVNVNTLAQLQGLAQAAFQPGATR